VSAVEGGQARLPRRTGDREPGGASCTGRRRGHRTAAEERLRECSRHLGRQAHVEASGQHKQAAAAVIAPVGTPGHPVRRRGDPTGDRAYGLERAGSS